jgi:NADH dehydrogenase/NADH:ubiquinone oxidoreductase subunit G
MVTFELNGLEVSVEKGTTVLEAAMFYGIGIPTLCYNEALSSYGACRLCLVEIGRPPRTQLVTACTYQVTEDLVVRTHSERVIKTRRMLIEMYLATCPSSKVIQDLASKYHVTRVRFRQKHEDCILCGLCIRMCEEQMQSAAIGYTGRGDKRRISTFFDRKSEECRLCGGCMYICPACQARCQGPDEKEAVCSACLNLSPPCLENFDDMMCYMDPCVACEEKSGREAGKTCRK